MLVYFAVSAAVIATDQLVKAWAVSSLRPVGAISVIQGVFGLTYAENNGAAFSILAGRRWFFLAAGVLAVAVLVRMAAKGFFTTRLSRVSVALLLGGIVGNLIDRARQGFVVDMFEIQFVRFAIFNVADVALTIGVGLLIIYILTMKEEAGENKDTDSRA